MTGRDRDEANSFGSLVEEVLLTDSDELADYSVVRVRARQGPLYVTDAETGQMVPAPPRFVTYLSGRALLSERPLPADWFYFCRWDTTHPEYDGNVLFRDIVVHGGAGIGLKDGRLSLSFSSNLPGDDERPECADPAWVLAEAKRMARSADIAWHNLRRDEPGSFIHNVRIVDLQRQAAQFRKMRDQGPTLIPEITAEQAAKWGEQGADNRRLVFAWNAESRRSFAESMAELTALEKRIRELGADPLDDGGWVDPAEFHARIGPHDGRPALGWDMSIPAAISDDALLYEITALAEAASPDGFTVQFARPGAIEIRSLRPHPPSDNPFPTESPAMPWNSRYWGDLSEERALVEALGKAARRWRVATWAIPERGTATPRHWGGPSDERWTLAERWIPAVRDSSQSDSAPSGLVIEVQLAPPGSRLPDEWEC